MIPANITTALASLQAQVAAATPLANANRSAIIALQLNAETLVASVDAAQGTLAGTLDTWTAPTDPGQIIAGVLGLGENATDENNIVLLRGVVGRVASNLNQLP